MQNRLNFICKKHTKFCRATILCVFLFLFSSCGIPTYLYLLDSESDDYSYCEFDSTSNSDGSISTNLKFNIDSSYEVDGTPSICYFYAIYPSSISSDVSEKYFSDYIVSEFEDTYSDNYPGQRLDTSSDESYVLIYETNDIDIKLYKFTYDGLEQDALSYLATAYDYDNDSFSYVDWDVNFDISYNSTDNYFEFTQDDSDTDSFTTKNSLDNYVDTENLTLKRYNKSKFITSDISTSDYDYLCTDIDEVNESVDFTVYVYAALTVEGNFTNIVWSDLHEVGSFDL